MSNNSFTPAASVFAIILLLWASLGPVFASALSFFGALPTQFPAVGYFATSPLEWRLVFFLAGCAAVTSAWLVYKGLYRYALAATVLFAAMYLPAFPLVWGQRSFGMVLAVAAVAVVGALAFVRRRNVV